MLFPGSDSQRRAYKPRFPVCKPRVDGGIAFNPRLKLLPAGGPDERSPLARELPLSYLTPIRYRGHIMKNASRLLAFGAATLLPIAAAIAQTPGPTPEPSAPTETPPQSQGTTFESLDTNSDGRISKDEAEGNANVKAQFSRYDVNGDGFIERAEVNQANKPQGEPAQQ
jgi:EF hand